MRGSSFAAKRLRWRSQPVGASLLVVDDVMCGGGDGCGSGRFSVEQQNLLWALWRRGDSMQEMERTLGETLPRIRRFLRQWVGSLRFRGSAGQSSDLGRA